MYVRATRTYAPNAVWLVSLFGLLVGAQDTSVACQAATAPGGTPDGW
jgi:hypothetical protein